MYKKLMSAFVLCLCALTFSYGQRQEKPKQDPPKREAPFRPDITPPEPKDPPVPREPPAPKDPPSVRGGGPDGTPGIGIHRPF